MVSSQFEDEDVDSVKVPIYENDQTTNADKSTSAMTPADAAGKNPSSGNGAFEKRLADLAKTISDLTKATAGGTPESSQSGAQQSEAEVVTQRQKRADGETLWPDDMNDAEFRENEQARAHDVGQRRSAPRPIRRSNRRWRSRKIALTTSRSKRGAPSRIVSRAYKSGRRRVPRDCGSGARELRSSSRLGDRLYGQLSV